MKRMLCALISLCVLLLAFSTVCMSSGAEAQEGWISLIDAIELLQNHCYVQQDGDPVLHTNQNCAAVTKQYLPMKEIPFTYTDEMLESFIICSHCTGYHGIFSQSEYIGSHALSPSNELSSLVSEWEKTYGDHRLWDYRINADFGAAYWNYATEPLSLGIPGMPDAESAPEETIKELAYHFIPIYPAGIQASYLETLKCVMESYWPEENCWTVTFWQENDAEEPVLICRIYIHKDGYPEVLLVYPDERYDGIPIEGMYE